ncbi:hypothetical protein [Pajaroellobacter abortibovis]|nr:hypothetical protein [Pajaroellobacter abortibovis]
MKREGFYEKTAIHLFYFVVGDNSLSMGGCAGEEDLTSDDWSLISSSISAMIGDNEKTPLLDNANSLPLWYLCLSRARPSSPVKISISFSSLPILAK